MLTPVTFSYPTILNTPLVIPIHSIMKSLLLILISYLQLTYSSNENLNEYEPAIKSLKASSQQENSLSNSFETNVDTKESLNESSSLLDIENLFPIPLLKIKKLNNHVNIFHFQSSSEGILEIRGNEYNYESDDIIFFEENSEFPKINKIICKLIPFGFVDFGFMLKIFTSNEDKLEILFFENCHFLSNFSRELGNFKFKTAESLTLKNCSISKKNLSAFISALPKSLTQLCLCGIRYEGNKVQLNWHELKRFKKLNNLQLDDMLLDKNDTICELARFKKLSNLSLADNLFDRNAFPFILMKSLKKLEKLDISSSFMYSLTMPITMMEKFSESLRFIRDNSCDMREFYKVKLSDESSRIILDCDIPNDLHYLFDDFSFIFRLTSHSIDINHALLDNFMIQLEENEEKGTLNLDHVTSIKFRREISDVNLGQTFKFLSFLPKLKNLSFEIQNVGKSIIRIMKKKFNSLPEIDKLTVQVSKSIGNLINPQDFIFEILKLFPNLKTIEIPEVMWGLFDNSFGKRREDEELMFRNLEFFSIEYSKFYTEKNLKCLLWFISLPTVKRAKISINFRAKISPKGIKELKKIPSLALEKLSIHESCSEDSNVFTFFKLLIK